MPLTSDTPTIPGPSLIFDKDRDIILTVGTNPSEKMLVDSHVLCRSSPVFRKMLRGPFAERKPEHGNWSIGLPGDDKESFAVLMDMAHGLYSRVHEEITVEKLYRLCVLTDKYDMVSVLRPMERRWSWQILRLVKNLQCQTENYRKSMFILFELGRRENVRRMVSDLARDCPTNVNGDFIDKNGVPLRTQEPFNMFSISNLLERITDERRKTLASLKTGCHEFTTRALEGNPGWKTSVNNRNICGCPSKVSTNTILGNMLSRAHELGLMGLFLPLATAPKITSSISDFWIDIGKIEHAASDTCICFSIDGLSTTLSLYGVQVLTKEEETYMKGQAAKARML